jgi:hypothetical protein
MSSQGSGNTTLAEQRRLASVAAHHEKELREMANADASES